MEDLESLSLVDLRLVAKKWGIKGVTAYRKQELLEFLKEEQATESKEIDQLTSYTYGQKLMEEE